MTVERIREQIYNAFVMVLVGLAVPFCFIWAITSVFEAAAGVTLLRPWYYPVLAGAAALRFLLDRLIRREKTTPLTFVRVALIGLVGAFGLASLVRNEGFTFLGQAEAGFLYFYLWLALLVEWILVYWLDAFLLERAHLVRLMRKELGSEEGREAIRQSRVVADIDRPLQRLKFMLAVQGVLVVLVIVVVGALARPAHGFPLAPSAASLAAVFAGIMAVGLYREEQRRFSEGLFDRSPPRARRFLIAFGFLGFAVLLAVLAAGNRPLVDLSPLRPAPMPITSRFPNKTWQAGGTFQAYQTFAEKLSKAPGGPSPEFVTALGIVLFSLLAFLVVLTLAAPLFSKRVRRSLRGARPGRLLKVLARHLAGWARRIASLFGRRSAGTGKAAEEGAPPGGGGRGRRASRREAEREANRIVRRFRLLMRWAADRRIRYRFGQTAAEFVAAVERRFPGERERLRLILETFERALFSPRPVTRDEERRYAECVRAVTRRKNL